jgi:hypothetical protein
MAVGLGFFLLFFFVGETFWDRTPRPKHITQHLRPSFHMHVPQMLRTHSLFSAAHGVTSHTSQEPMTPSADRKPRNPDTHVAFQEKVKLPDSTDNDTPSSERIPNSDNTSNGIPITRWKSPQTWDIQPEAAIPEVPKAMPDLRNLNSPWYVEKANTTDYFSVNTSHGSEPPAASEPVTASPEITSSVPQMSLQLPPTPKSAHNLPISQRSSAEKHVVPGPGTGKPVEPETGNTPQEQTLEHPPGSLPSSVPSSELEPNKSKEKAYTEFYRSAPPKTYWEGLRPWAGRLSRDNWFKVATRPFILFAYPAILWSAVVYSLSIGWLIVLSESVSTIYKSKDTYHFTSLQTGLVYLSPFIGGVLGTAVAGKLSDVIVRFMARRNDGVYEPEFRLVMGIPVAISTTIGLMGFGWSAQERDNWIVPTIFFGVISFGCSLGSTTSITFAVDSYRQYAGEALVTLNFAKSKSHSSPFLSCSPKYLHLTRHLPRSRLLPILPQMARIRRQQKSLHRHRRHSDGLPALHCANVHIRQKSTDVDGAEKPDGEILIETIKYGVLEHPDMGKVFFVY